MEKKKNFVIQALLWVIQGFIVGIGAILPGVSGGSLCYVFGIYDPVLDVLSNPLQGLKKHWKMKRVRTEITISLEKEKRLQITGPPSSLVQLGIIIKKVIPGVYIYSLRNRWI